MHDENSFAQCISCGRCDRCSNVLEQPVRVYTRCKMFVVQFEWTFLCLHNVHCMPHSTSAAQCIRFVMLSMLTMICIHFYFFRKFYLSIIRMFVDKNIFSNYDFVEIERNDQWRIRMHSKRKISSISFIRRHHYFRYRGKYGEFCKERMKEYVWIWTWTWTRTHTLQPYTDDD